MHPPRASSRRLIRSAHGVRPYRARKELSALFLLTRSSLLHPIPPAGSQQRLTAWWSPARASTGPAASLTASPPVAVAVSPTAHPHHSPFHPSPSPLPCSTAPPTSPPSCDTRSSKHQRPPVHRSSFFRFPLFSFHCTEPAAGRKQQASGRSSWRATATGRTARRRRGEATATAGTRAGRAASGGPGSCPPSSSPASRCSPWRCTRTTAPRTVAGSAGASPASCSDSPSSRSARTRSSGRPLPRTFLLQANLSFC
jgi:hypothetical protein